MHTCSHMCNLLVICLFKCGHMCMYVSTCASACVRTLMSSASQSLREADQIALHTLIIQLRKISPAVSPTHSLLKPASSGGFCRPRSKQPPLQITQCWQHGQQQAQHGVSLLTAATYGESNCCLKVGWWYLGGTKHVCSKKKGRRNRGTVQILVLFRIVQLLNGP